MKKTLALLLTGALLALGATSALAATSAEQAYQRPEAVVTPAQAPVIPTVAPAEERPGPQPVAQVGREDQPAVEAAGARTLPVTGFEALLIFGIAAGAGAAGYALRKASTK